MSSGIVYLAVFLLSTSGGLTVEADGDCYETYDACMLQAEADAKNMAASWKAGGSRRPFFKTVSVRCDGMSAEQAKKEGRHVYRSR